jgi:hypothetical protein
MLEYDTILYPLGMDILWILFNSVYDFSSRDFIYIFEKKKKKNC